VLGEIVTRETKRDLLVAARDRLGLHPAATLAVGDGANDLPMLLEAGLGIAFRAKPTVRARAAATVDHADLSALLYAQGYPDRDIAWPEDDRPTLALPPPPDGVAEAGLPTSGEA
jgi:phosphoserine phosphatase